MKLNSTSLHIARKSSRPTPLWLAISIASLLAAQSARAGTTIDWNAAGTVWGLGANWGDGTGSAPADDSTAAGDVAQFNLATYANQPNVSAAARGVRGITIGSTSGATVTITSGTTGTGLTIGDAGIDMSAAAANLTLGATNNKFTIGANQTWTIASGTLLTVTGVLDLANNLILNGPGTFQIGTVSTGAGQVTLNSGMLRMTPDSAKMGTGKMVINGGTLAAGGSGGNFALTNSSYDIGGDFTVTGGGKNHEFGTGAVTLVGATRMVTVTSGIARFQGAVGDGIISNGYGLTKAGGNGLVLTGNNTYTGTTTVNAGTLHIGGNLNNGGIGTNTTAGTLSTSSAIVLGGGTLQFNRSNAVAQGTDFSGAAITGTGGFTHNGSGTLELNVANTYSGGATTVSSTGNLILKDKAAIQNSTLTLSSTGTVIFDSTATGTTWTVGGLAGSLNLALADSASAAVALTISGNGSNGSYSGVLSGAGGLIKNGTNTQTLTGNSNFTGATTINNGILKLTGTTYSFSGTSGISVNGGGTFQLGNGSPNPSFAVDLSGAPITLNGGTFTVRGGTGTSGATFNEALGSSITVSANSVLTADYGQGSNQTFNIGSSWSLGAVTLAISGNNTNNINLGPTTLTGNAVITNALGTTSSSTALVTLGDISGGTNTLEYQSSAGRTLVLGGSGASNVTGLVTLTSGLLNLNKTGFNAIGANGVTVNGGTMKLVQANQIDDAATVTVNTGGTFNLNALNETIGNLIVGGGTVSSATSTLTVSGATTVNSGTLSVANLVTGTGDLTLGNSATVSSATALNGNVVYNGTTTGATFGAGAITLNGNRTFTVADGAAATDFTVSGIVSNGAVTPSALTKAGLGTMVLSTANTYTGATAVSAGTLSLTGSLTGSNVSTSGTGIFTQSAAGVIAGSGVTLTQGSTGTSTLAGANTYTGATAVTAGTLSISNAATFTNTSQIALSGTGRLDVNVANQSLAKVATGGGVPANTFLRLSQNQATAGTGPGTIFGTLELNLAAIAPNYALSLGAGSGVTGIITSTFTPTSTDVLGDTTFDGVATTMIFAGPVSTSTGGLKTITLNSTGASSLSGLLTDGSGSLALVKTGVGSWSASNTANTFTGGVLIKEGNFRVDAASNTNTGFSSAGSNATAITIGDTSGTKAAVLSILNGNRTIFNNITVNTGGVNTILSNLSTGSFFAGAITMNSALTLQNTAAGGSSITTGGITTNGNKLTINNSSSGGWTISSAITGSSAIEMNSSGLGALTLSGTNTSYTGAITITAGTLKASSLNALGASSGSAAITVNGTLQLTLAGVGDYTGGQINLNNGSTLLFDCSTGGSSGTSKITVAAGATSAINGSTTTNRSYGIAKNGLDMGAGATLNHTVAGTDFQAYSTEAAVTLLGSATVNVTSPGSIKPVINYAKGVTDNGGNFSLTKGGTGTLVLGATVSSPAITGAVSSYGGATIVTAGTLRIGIADSLPDTALAVNTAATFDMSVEGNGASGSRILNATFDQRVAGLNDGVGGGGTVVGNSINTANSGNIGNRTLTLDGATGTFSYSGVIINKPVANVTANNQLSLTKSGGSIQTLSGTNTYTGVTTVSGGVLRLENANALPGGVGTAGGTSNLTFNGGVIGLGSGNSPFTRALGNSANTAAATFTGAGGWAAYGADATVNLGGGGAITWATADTGFNGQTLILGASTADKTVDLQNSLDLGTAARTVQVDNGSAGIDAKLTGAITGGVGSELTKTGNGTLDLNGAPTYATLKTQAGVTNVNASFTGGTATVNANATTNFTVSQTLSALNIGSVALAAPAFAGGGASTAVVPEPGVLGLLVVGALGLAGRRRRGV